MKSKKEKPEADLRLDEELKDCETEKPGGIASEEPGELEILNAQNAEYLDKYLRTLADFDNFRKRTIKEKSAMFDDGVCDALQKLLPVVDNLERALNSSQDRESPLHKGIEMTMVQLSSVLQGMGVKRIEANGQPFDHAFHNAISHIEDESAGQNEIVQELQAGYLYKDKVLRHSVVVVAN